MLSKKCLKAVEKALKLMEEESPVYSAGGEFINSDVTKKFWKLRLGGKVNEQFDVLFLNSQYQQIRCETLFKGTINAASVYPRVLIQKILEHNAAAIIIAHNHPSGISTPSQSDIDLTNRIKEACSVIDVSLLDHVVVGNKIYTFSEHGLL